MRTAFATLALAAAVAAAGVPAFAHHSGAMFDRSKTLTLKGTVKEYQFASPHSWIDIAVKGDDGQVQNWAIEAQTPVIMRNLGVTPSNVKPGDVVTIRTHPLRDGRTGGSFVDITLANGQTLGTMKNVNLGAPPPAPAQ